MSQPDSYESNVRRKEFLEEFWEEKVYNFNILDYIDTELNFFFRKRPMILIF